jgi:predicted nuclease of predicted toxin-antitoxin system
VKRLLLDEGLPASTAVLLRQSGWDVVHVSEIGMSRASDADIVRRARAESRVCITLDADFHSIVATSGERTPSVIRIRKEGLDAMALAALLQRIWPGLEDALGNRALLTLTESSVRVRRLPIVRS